MGKTYWRLARFHRSSRILLGFQSPVNPPRKPTILTEPYVARESMFDGMDAGPMLLRTILAPLPLVMRWTSAAMSVVVL